MTSSSKTNSPNYERKTAIIRVKSPNYVNLESSSEGHHIERTPSPPLRKKSLSPPNAPSKSTSSKSTYQTTSSSPSGSPTPTHDAPPPKLRFVIPQELPSQQTPPHNIYVSTMDNWPPGPSRPSPPPRFSHQPLGFKIHHHLISHIHHHLNHCKKKREKRQERVVEIYELIEQTKVNQGWTLGFYDSEVKDIGVLGLVLRFPKLLDF
nr:hypothetical protein [Tanacetum cinerariifolium]